MWWVKIKSESRTVSRVRKPDKNFKPDENFKLRRFNVVEDMVEIFAQFLLRCENEIKCELSGLNSIIQISSIQNVI